MRFENKVAVVTGGAHGIGKAIADQFRAEGATVHIIEMKPGDWFVGDVGDQETLERFAKHVIRERGHVDYLNFTEGHLPENKDVFYIYTHGAPGGNFLKGMRTIAEGKCCREIGEYRCQGFDTFGPFKLVGGIAKGHPTGEEIQGAVKFYQEL